MIWIDAITRYLTGAREGVKPDAGTHDRMGSYNVNKLCEGEAIKYTQAQAQGRGNGDSPPLRRTFEHVNEEKRQMRTFIVCTGYLDPQDFRFAQGVRRAHNGERYEDGRAKGPCQFLLLDSSGEPVRVLAKRSDGVERQYPLCKFRTVQEARLARKVRGFGS